MELYFFMTHYYDSAKKQYMPFMNTNLAQNVMIDAETEETVADAIASLKAYIPQPSGEIKAYEERISRLEGEMFGYDKPRAGVFTLNVSANGKFNRFEIISENVGVLTTSNLYIKFGEATVNASSVSAYNGSNGRYTVTIPEQTGDSVKVLSVRMIGELEEFIPHAGTATFVPKAKYIALGDQNGTITAGSTGSVTFTITRINVDDTMQATAVWLSSAPRGLSLSVTGNTITVTATTTTLSGTYDFVVSVDGVSATASVKVEDYDTSDLPDLTVIIGKYAFSLSAYDTLTSSSNLANFEETYLEGQPFENFTPYLRISPHWYNMLTFMDLTEQQIEEIGFLNNIIAYIR